MVGSEISSRATRAGRAGGTQIEVLFADADRYAGAIVAAALARSFTPSQLAPAKRPAKGHRGRCAVWINPSEEDCRDLHRVVTSGGKAIVFGRIGPRVAGALGLAHCGPIAMPIDWAECLPDPRLHHDASSAAVRYASAHPLAMLAPQGPRPLCRFDFADEWNNLGFGRIALGGDAWSLQSAVEIDGATSLAQIATPDGDRLVYAALYETASGAALWFNRPVGPVDSLEWRIVESFLGDYRADDLPCLPYLGEIPAGYRAAVCSRLDCDEAVASARPLVELYHERGLPISLALLTGQPLDEADLQLMREVMVGGGSVVSHSHHHYPNWGGSYERARSEALAARGWFERHLSEAAGARYAVSPFHQNPSYAIAALADTGCEGFLGGIISGDPEFLLGRAGRVPFSPRPMVSLSTQCMLHGDCYRRYGNSIDAYCESFDQRTAAGAIFGYLDHPFSVRYQYGWSDEQQRLAAHRGLIDHIGRRSDVWWASIAEVLGFLVRRDAARVEVDRGGSLSCDAVGDAEPPLAIYWKGRQIAA